MNNFGHGLISSGMAWIGWGVFDLIDPPVWTEFAIAGTLMFAGYALCRAFRG
jgi:hypothetical protein